ncbi:glutamyl-tRNA reductase [Roseisolibacter sp. H3M3-2]|uniref:glutamyl-tRNA reductase n=1 Tax=Roseisolibacter sp. H3M3-2 TaxID=3031323 RepID=UPI0023DBF4C1|nr:glutamyl-tRNA reductase [Roseisolibacter sp. H3M3-2]MDF1501843.1 glutamyl-tRNA reductase [Roseisolibacter sp. H3M3-2]
MLISIAVDYRHADVATRERFHLTPERLAALYRAPAGGGAPQRVGMATCNRSELYAWVPEATARTLDGHLAALARAWMGTAAGARALLAVARRRSGVGAVHHLFRVASGIESQVLGDAQLLGQLREAYAHARDAHAAGSVLHRLFEHALRVGKRVRTETGLSSGRYSVGAEAANLAARRFGSLAHARVAVVGAGKTGERVARQLAKLGATDIVVLNRSPERAEALATAVRGRAAPLEALYGELALADIAIVATSAVGPLVYADPLVSARRRFATLHFPLLLVDLSVPRNVDPVVGGVPGCVVVDLDALRPAVAAGERERNASIPQAEALVEQEAAEYLEWLRAASAREAIRPLCDALAEVCRREVAFAAGDDVAARTAERIVAKVLARPMVELRGAVARGESLEEMVSALARLFPTAAPRGARAALALPGGPA